MIITSENKKLDKERLEIEIQAINYNRPDDYSIDEFIEDLLEAIDKIVVKENFHEYYCNKCNNYYFLKDLIKTRINFEESEYLCPKCGNDGYFAIHKKEVDEKEFLKGMRCLCMFCGRSIELDETEKGTLWITENNLIQCNECHSKEVDEK